MTDVISPCQGFALVPAVCLYLLFCVVYFLLCCSAVCKDTLSLFVVVKNGVEIPLLKPFFSGISIYHCIVVLEVGNSHSKFYLNFLLAQSARQGKKKDKTRIEDAGQKRKNIYSRRRRNRL